MDPRWPRWSISGHDDGIRLSVVHDFPRLLQDGEEGTETGAEVVREESALNLVHRPHPVPQMTGHQEWQGDGEKLPAEDDGQKGEAGDYEPVTLLNGPHVLRDLALHTVKH